jgi:NitT/TauT family transport system substrate-binding protein
MSNMRAPVRTALAALALLAGLAAAPARDAQAQSAAPARLEVGYIPIIPMSQLFVMTGEGWTREAGLALDLVRFQDGPAMVQALASGDMDAAYLGIGPAMVARARGIPIRVVAASTVEQIGVIARGRFGELAAAHGAVGAIERFRAERGAKPRIATLPRGSVPDTIARYWLRNTLSLGDDAVELVGMGAGRVQQALLAGQVDGAVILEPILTVVQERSRDARLIATSADILPGHGGSVLAVRESVLAERPEAVAALVRLHVRATELLTDEPERAVPHIAEAIGQGLLPDAVIAKALENGRGTFVSDPARILEPTREMLRFQIEIGSQEAEVDLDDLIDPSIHRAQAGG